jgi:hypothetical protein
LHHNTFFQAITKENLDAIFVPSQLEFVFTSTEHEENCFFGAVPGKCGTWRSCSCTGEAAYRGRENATSKTMMMIRLLRVEGNALMQSWLSNHQ